MIRGFRHLVQKVGLSVERASEAASLNPAKLIRIDHLTGSVETGKQADLLLVDRDLNLKDTWVKGQHFKA
ncbi:N-acetylglucosamine-6-phosphate deacetylase [compost metagenome]